MHRASVLTILVTCMVAAAVPILAQATPPPPQPPCEPVSPDVTSEALGRLISAKGELREGECAAQNLAERGADAVPTVLDLLRLRDTHVEMLALTALAGIGPQAQAALPDLMERLRKPSTLQDKYLYDAVVSLGPAARPAIPLLIARSRIGAHPYYPQHASWPLHALGRLGKHDPDRVVPYLATLLLDRENDQPVLDALADIGHDAHAAVPAILLRSNGQPSPAAGRTAPRRSTPSSPWARQPRACRSWRSCSTIRCWAARLPPGWRRSLPLSPVQDCPERQLAFYLSPNVLASLR